MIKTDYDDLETLLAAFNVPLTAAQIHGYLAGLVVTGSQGGMQTLLDHAEMDVERLEPLVEGLAAVSEEIRQGFAEPEPFDPLLPDDDSPLVERVAALGDWCSGLLSGLSDSEPGGGMSAEAQEVVEDIQALAEAEYSGDDEAEEVAFTELTEFLRVAVALLFAELLPVSHGEDGDE
ncbi:MAG: UPF0149 family protein [Gammaproteobacteria bacterium]|nr:UPF0149 family protein [Gammaproteobacteria bacterium]